MIVLGELLVAVAWTFGANGFLIDRQLDGSRVLPVAWLEPVAERARIVFHDRRDWTMAFYLPAESGRSGDNAAELRLVLYAPYFLAQDGLVTAPQMPVDVAEYYFRALLEAVLDPRRADGARARRFADRAGELMREVPEAQRLAAYLSALGDFGAHALSIANEIDRAARRHRAAGRDLCRLIGSRESLFGLWARSFGELPYRGRYLLAGAADGHRWATSRRALERRDKELVAKEILGTGWTGDPERDFAPLCR